MNKTHPFSFFILLLFFFSVGAYAQSPSYLWAKSAFGKKDDNSRDMATDKLGNTFVLGEFYSDTIIFGSTTLLKTTTIGESDVFIAKFDPSGNVLWAKSASGSANDRGYGVAVDTSGSVYITGYFISPTITFGTTTLTNANSSSVFADGFIVKYDPSGTVIWAKRFGGSDYDVANDIAIDKTNNVFVVGAYDSPSVTFGTTTLNNSSPLYGDGFVVKYSSSGSLVWAQNIGGSIKERAYRVCTDVSGGVLVAGQFSSPTMTFGTSILTNRGMEDNFVAKYDSSGNPVWAQAVGGTADESSADILSDSNGNVYFLGAFYCPILFVGNDSLYNSGTSSVDGFIVKYNSTGSLLWFKGFGGNKNDEFGRAALDLNEDIIVGGDFISDTIFIDSDTIINASPPFWHSFNLKINKLGALVWVKRPVCQKFDAAMSVSISSSGDIYVTGPFWSPTISFDATTLINSDSFSISRDVYLIRLNDPTYTEDIYEKKQLVTVYPNPFSSSATIEIKDFKNDFSVLYLFDITGREVYKKQITNRKTEIQKGNLNAGMYFYKVLSKGNSIGSGKIIIQ